MRSIAPVCTLLLLAGCDNRQDGVPLAASGSHAEHSWISAKSSNADLLYISNINGTVTVYDFNTGALVGKLAGFQRPKGECVDGNGDVFITDRVAENIVEYAHGGTSPLAVIHDDGFQDYACSVDPTTGDLAVANSYQKNGDAGEIAVFTPGSSAPRTYRIPRVPNPLACAYDASGNLLVASDYRHNGGHFIALAYLQKGGSAFTRISVWLDGRHVGGVYNVQWDGEFWALSFRHNILRFNFGQSSGTQDSTVYLRKNDEHTARFWIADGRIVIAQPASVLYWNYPAGGYSIAKITDGLDTPYGVAISPK